MLLPSRAPPRQTLCIFAFYGLTLALAHDRQAVAALGGHQHQLVLRLLHQAPLLIATLIALAVSPDPKEEDPPSYNRS